MRQTPLALALAASLAAPVCAETLPIFVGDTVVVTPTRIPQTVASAIGDVTVVTVSEIAASGQTTLLELLQAQPAIEITQSGGAGTAAGVRIRGGNPGHTLVLVDGLRVGSATLGTTPLENVALDQIERIEILRGPASSLYGADAVAGVIQIFTRRGKGAPHLNVQAGAGSDGLLQGNVQYSGRAGNTHFSLGAGYARTDGGFSAAGPAAFGYNPDDDGNRKTSLHLSLDHVLGARHSAGVTVLANRDRVEYDAGTLDDFSRNSVNAGSVWWKGQLTDAWRSRLSAGLGQNHTDNFSLGVSTGRFDTDQRQYQWQNDFSLPVGELSASLERLEQEVDASQIVYTQRRRTVNAALVGYQASIGAHALQLSLRRDDYSDFGGQTTGMAGYAYAFAPAWRVAASVGTSFKAPTFNDMYYPSTLFFVGNPALQPERGRNAELSLRFRQSRSHASLTGYRNRVQDLIAYVFPTMQNVNRATLEGLTLAGGTEIAGARIEASLDWQNAEDRATGKALTYRARRYGSLDIARDFGAIELGATLVASGPRFVDAANTRTLAGYARLDLRASYAIRPEWRLLARVNNALDADYALFENYNTPGVNGFLGIEYRPR